MHEYAAFITDQRNEDQCGGNILRRDAGDCHARHVEIADDYEKQIEKYVDHARDTEENKRAFRIARSAQYAVTEVVEGKSGKPERVDF